MKSDKDRDKDRDDDEENRPPKSSADRVSRSVKCMRKTGGQEM